MSEENTAIVERLTRELFNDGGDIDVADELLADDFVDHTPAAGSAGDRESYKQRAAIMRGPFSDIRTVSEEIVAEGDLVAERWRSSFTHSAEFMGISPSGRSVEILGFAMYRIRDGKVVEFWGLSDSLGLMEQLGALHPRE
jgi:predicted ester cyclase